MPAMPFLVASVCVRVVFRRPFYHGGGACGNGGRGVNSLAMRWASRSRKAGGVLCSWRGQDLLGAREDSVVDQAVEDAARASVGHTEQLRCP